jgi:hypothetical protein
MVELSTDLPNRNPKRITGIPIRARLVPVPFGRLTGVKKTVLNRDEYPIFDGLCPKRIESFAIRARFVPVAFER